MAHCYDIFPENTFKLGQCFDLKTEDVTILTKNVIEQQN